MEEDGERNRCEVGGEVAVEAVRVSSSLGELLDEEHDFLLIPLSPGNVKGYPGCDEYEFSDSRGADDPYPMLPLSPLMVQLLLSL